MASVRCSCVLAAATLLKGRKHFLSSRFLYLLVFFFSCRLICDCPYLRFNDAIDLYNVEFVNSRQEATTKMAAAVILTQQVRRLRPATHQLQLVARRKAANPPKTRMTRTNLLRPVRADGSVAFSAGRRTRNQITRFR